MSKCRGREGLPRSLGSVYAGSVVRFLGGFRGATRRVIATLHGRSSYCSGMAVSRDGCTMFVVGGGPSSQTNDMLCVYHVRDGAPLGSVAIPCDGQVWVAPDDFVFLAHWRSGVKVLAPCLDVQGVIPCAGARGACADDQCVFVAVSVAEDDTIVVFSRDTGAMRRRFGRRGVGYGDLLLPRRTCFVSRNRRIAVANSGHDRVSVFSVDGVFVRNVGVGMLRHPMSVACSAGGDELVVADYGHCRLVVFSASDELLHVVRDGQFTSVAIHGSTVFALTSSGFGSTFVAVE